MTQNNLIKSIEKSFAELFLRPKKQIPAMDGLRTIAILLVVGLHSALFISRAGFETNFLYNIPPFRGGWVGVPLFFVLSGYFIGGQLWKEFLREGSVSIGSFILRRGLRIWPLYYFVLLAVVAIFPEKCIQTWTNLFFVANYFGDEGPIRGAWSLSTEEQFYILIPSLIFVSAKYFGFKSLAHYRKLLFVLLFLPILSRSVTWLYLTNFEFFEINLYQTYIYKPFHTHFDGLIAGLLISNILMDQTIDRSVWIKKSRWVLPLSCLFFIGLSLWQKVPFNYTALALCFGSTVWLVLNSENILTRILSWRPFYWTAKVSFGVYLVHHPVLWSLEQMGWFSKVFINPTAFLLTTYAITDFASCIVCSFTYILIEAPFIHWRDKVLQRKRETKPELIKVAV